MASEKGALTAVLNTLVYVYTYEMCGQQLRGLFLGILEIWATLGFLLTYLTGCFLSWYTIAWFLPLVTLMPGFIGLCASLESPLWLARKGREEEAEAVLKLVRCTTEEIREDLQTAHITLRDKPSCMSSLQDAAKKPNFLAITASCLILIMKELGGFAVLSIYIVYIFDQAGVGMDSNWSSVVVGFARLTCNCFASFLLHRWSRKYILVVGNIFTGIACALIGIFFFLQYKEENISHISWLPLAGLVMHMIAYAGGVGPCTWVVAAEVLPGPVRSLGFGIASAAYAMASFLVSKTFIDLKGIIGLHGVFWVFTGGSVCYILLVLLYIPETYGCSMKDIEDYWKNLKKKSKGVHV
ncbi:hypothetical protein SK128_000229 [Halocaridina rubra]|uniref:Major facilitator superfamily (MFS) profile domain-containing protein n=1 Tax=Halocaridina rubra TaxID=373956 RepID=A0AAN8ZVC6_HALRR